MGERKREGQALSLSAIGSGIIRANALWQRVRQGFGMQVVYALFAGGLGFGISYFVIDRLTRR